MNESEQLDSVVARFIAEAEADLISVPADECTRREFLKLRELRALLFGG